MFLITCDSLDAEEIGWKDIKIQSYEEMIRCQVVGESGRRAAATLRPSSARRLYVEHALRYSWIEQYDVNVSQQSKAR